jgi:uncharacterized protein (TIGR02270 family)
VSAPTLTFIPDILEEHVEEIGFLWGQRRAALRSPIQTKRDLLDLEERIAAHLQGVLAVGDRALPLLEETLASDDEFDAFSAGWALLHADDEATADRVLAAFQEAEGDRINGLADALSQTSLSRGMERIDGIFRSSSGLLSTAAGKVLAFHSSLRPDDELIRSLLADEDPDLRRDGWILVAYVGASVGADSYASAMRDKGPKVRHAAMEAAAWCGEQGILAVCRQLAEEPVPENLDAMQTLAVLGTHDDLPRFKTLGSSVELGSERFGLLAAYGHPSLMELVLDGIGDGDGETAIAAGTAFTRMTGLDIESDDRVQLAPKDEELDAFEMEFVNEAFLPDEEMARRHWEETGPKFGSAVRICQGFDISQDVDPAAFSALDMKSRWSLHLRARFRGQWMGSPINLEVFPQRASGQTT